MVEEENKGLREDASNPPSENAKGQDEKPSEAAHVIAPLSDSSFSTDLLKIYYSRLFPYKEMIQWLSYGNDRKLPGSDGGYMKRREWSFTLEHDIYVRYQSFRDAGEMEAAIRDKCPHKIDIGAVYNVDPSRRTAYQGIGSESAFAPVERELVFDVDMSDYDDVRTCCSGASVCSKCWPLMTAAIQVVHAALKADFGFSHILWVFSGRRGVHCWVCDRRARKLTNEQRSAVAEYFRVYKGTEGSSSSGVSFNAPTLHPSLARAYTLLEGIFVGELLEGQQLLSSAGAWSKVLAMVQDQDVQAQLDDRWRTDRRATSAADRWKQLKAAVASAAKKNSAVRKAVEEIVFVHAYPRLDIEVSKHMNHLLKAPFCIHPKTGFVCVPIDPDKCAEFEPSKAPTLATLLDEINARRQTMGKDSMQGQATASDTERTSMGPYITFFRERFLNPLFASAKEDLEVAHKQKLKASANVSNAQW